MSLLFYAANLILLVSFVVLARQVNHAPEGHEDEVGFHFGAPTSRPETRQAGPVRRAPATATFAKVPQRHLAA